MRRHKTDSNDTLNGRQRLELYRKLFMEARPIWKGCRLPCCMVIITAGVCSKLTGQITNEICAYWEAKVSGDPLWDLVQQILPGLLTLFGVYVLGAAVRYGNMYLMNNMVSRHYTCAIRIRMSDKIQRLPVKFVDSTPVGQILEQMTDDVSAMGTSIHQIVDTLMQGLLQIALIAVALLMEDWRLGLIVLATTPISMLLSVVISNASEKYYHKMFQEGAQLYSIVEEGYTNFSTTKAYNLEQAMVEKHQKVNRRQRKVQAQAAFVSGLVQPMIVLANALTYIAVNLVGGYLIVKGRLPVGTVVTVILFARQFSAPLEQISEGLSQMQRTTAAARRVFHLLELPEEDPRQGQVQPEEVQGRVEFRHVSFSYDPKQPLIRDLSFTAEPGQTIAIVGPTGAGKTTIVNLLMGFYDISAGEIFDRWAEP